MIDAIRLIEESLIQKTIQGENARRARLGKAPLSPEEVATMTGTLNGTARKGRAYVWTEVEHDNDRDWKIHHATDLDKDNEVYQNNYLPPGAHSTEAALIKALHDTGWAIWCRDPITGKLHEMQPEGLEIALAKGAHDIEQWRLKHGMTG